MNTKTIETAADVELQSDLERIFSKLDGALLPGGVIERVHSFGLAEDGLTHFVMIDMADGATVWINLKPGEPISVREV